MAQKYLLITRWAEWQKPALSEVRKKREKRGTDPRRPYSLPWFAVASSFNDNGGRGSFQTFAELVGGEVAVGHWISVLQYVALHDPFRGCLAVDPSMFGRTVLNQQWIGVNSRTGKRVYDALLKSGLAEEIEPTDPRLSLDASYPASTPASPDPSQDASRREERRGDTTPSPSSAVASSANGHGPVARGSELAEGLRRLYRGTGSGTPLGRAINHALALRAAGDPDFERAADEALAIAARGNGA